MDATRKPEAQKRKTWPWVRATQSAGGNQLEKRRQDEGKIRRKILKERMGGQWGANVEPRERKGFDQDHGMVGGGCLTTEDAEPDGSQEAWVLVLILPLTCCLTLGEPLCPFSGPDSSSKKVRGFDTKGQTLYV